MAACCLAAGQLAADEARARRQRAAAGGWGLGGSGGGGGDGFWAEWYEGAVLWTSLGALRARRKLRDYGLDALLPLELA